MSVPAQEYDDGPSKDGPSNYAPKKVRHPEPAPDPAGVPSKADSAGQTASPKREASGLAEPPWRWSRQRGAFVGDIAAVELRNRLALAPDRLPEPPPALSTGPRYSRRLAVLVIVAAVGFVGYQLGSAPPSTPPGLAPHLGQLAGQPGVGRLSAGEAVDTARGASTGPAMVNGAPAAQPSQPVLSSAATAKEIALPSKARNVIASAQPASRQLDAEEIAVMIKSGADLMANRDFAAARLMYQRAAEAGSAMAAFALAETYDPLMVGKLNVRGGISPDSTLAATWYEKAKALGSSEAPERLERLARLPEQ
jgi:hypothetical protein